MAIQFPCSRCHKLIEVDDEQAGRPALCPYCNATIQAPLRSPAEARVATAPRASISAPDTSVPTGTTQPDLWSHLPPLATQTRNRAGNWGLALGVLAWLIGGATGLFMFSLVGERLVDENGEMQLDPPPDPQQMSELMQELLVSEEHASTFVLAGFSMLACAIAGVILSVIGLRKVGARRGTAIAGLIVGGLPLCCQCLSRLGAVGGG